MRRTAVRLVTVIGSPGSVGPLFAEQIARGGPVTVTHPEAQRYFLTIDETVRLLAESIAHDDATGVLVPEPNAPIRIAELAERMIAASRRDVQIAYTGQRAGDKLYEALVGPAERLEGTATAGLQRVISPRCDRLELYLRAIERAVATRDLGEALRVVGELVPDYEPSALVRAAATEPARAGR